MRESGEPGWCVHQEHCAELFTSSLSPQPGLRHYIFCCHQVCYNSPSWAHLHRHSSHGFTCSCMWANNALMWQCAEIKVTFKMKTVSRSCRPLNDWKHCLNTDCFMLLIPLKPAPTCSRGSYVSLTITRRGSLGQCLIKYQMTWGLIYIFPLMVMSMKKLEEPYSRLSCPDKWCGGTVRGITRPQSLPTHRPQRYVLSHTFFLHIHTR